MKIYLMIFLVVLLIAGTMGTGIAISADSDDTVTLAEAQRAAIDRLVKVDGTLASWDGTRYSWGDAVLTDPVIYFAPDNTKSAYEFSLISDSKDVGYILVSARKSWTPVLEYSSAPAPSKQLSSASAYAVKTGWISSRDLSNVRFIYWGAASYSVQIGNKMKERGLVIHLPTAQLTSMPKMEALNMDAEKSRSTWEKFADSGLVQRLGNSVTSLFKSSPILASPSNESLFVMENSQYIVDGWVYGMPVWWQHSDAEQSACQTAGWDCDSHDDQALEYPYCVGQSYDDLWYAWDGCSCIAGAMILGYHGASSSDDEVIDHLHYYMQTLENGETYPWNFDYGIESVFDYIYSMDFNASNNYFISWGDVTGEIDADRPFMISYGGHSQACAGYRYDTDDEDYRYLFLATTWASWGNSFNVVSDDNWGAAVMTKVVEQ